MPRTKDADFFLKTLREMGSSAGNKALRQRLGPAWVDEAKYFGVRQRLIAEGLVDTGRGRGGSVYIIGDEDGEEVPQIGEVGPAIEDRKAEADYYQYVLQKLKEYLSQDFNEVVIDVTAFPAGNPTGKWSRPDLLAVTVQRFDYVAEDEFMLRSYEVKRSTTVDMDAVAEAAAHKRIAQLAHLLIVQDGDDTEIFDPTNHKRRSIERECLKAGVGLILVYQSDESAVEPAIEATPARLSYRDVNSTIGRLFSEEKRDEIKKFIAIRRSESVRSLAGMLAQHLLGAVAGQRNNIDGFIDAFEDIVKRHDQHQLSDAEFEAAKSQLLKM